MEDLNLNSSDPVSEKVIVKIRRLFPKVGDAFPCDTVKNCSYKPKSFIASNCVRHIKEQHPEQYNLLNLGKRLTEDEVSAALNKKRTKIAPADNEVAIVRISRSKLIGGIIKLLTIHRCPFQSVEWEGLRDLVEPALGVFRIKLNRNNAPALVAKASKEVDRLISTEVKMEMVALKFDTTSKLNRSVLGVSAQFYKELTLTNRCLGIIELTTKHTAENLVTEIINLTAGFGMDIWQYYSATIDNAKNGIKAITCIRAEQEDAIISEFFDEDDDDDEYDPATIDPRVSLCEEAMNTHYIECVRCGSHTINLVVKDATKEKEKDLKQVVAVVKAYRRGEFIARFRHTGIPLPPIPNATRWNHHYLMTRSLQKNREFFTGLSVMHPDLDLSNFWALIDDYSAAFEPLFEASVRSQALACLISDFHLAWLKAYGRIKRLDDQNSFKQAILVSMESRLQTLMSSMAYKAVLYLDPRLNFAGSHLFKTMSEKEDIVEFLIKVWRKIEAHTHNIPVPLPSTSSNDSTTASNSTSDDFDLDGFISETVGEGTSNMEEHITLKKKLADISLQPRISANDSTFNLVHHYYVKKLADERLWKIARVVLSAAASQADIEQDFSQFNIVYTTLRNRLSGKNSDNILKVNLNRELLPAAIPAALAEFCG